MKYFFQPQFNNFFVVSSFVFSLNLPFSRLSQEVEISAGVCFCWSSMVAVQVLIYISRDGDIIRMRMRMGIGIILKTTTTTSRTRVRSTEMTTMTTTPKNYLFWVGRRWGGDCKKVNLSNEHKFSKVITTLTKVL